ncbi:MAG: membrane-bound lytic murein transglycosylase MltF [Halioglobus sp.]|nr:membrane-bound lytic murein transglycosylase MltF [Halioglobus sp.]
MSFCKLILVAALLFLMGGCDRPDSLEEITARGELNVASRNSPTTYYLGKNGPTGFEFALTTLLAQELGVELSLEPAFTLRGIFKQLNREEADLAAAGLALTKQRGAVYPHSISYYTLIPQVVYFAGTFRPRSVEDLVEMKIVVLAGSSNAMALLSLQQTQVPELNWEEIHGADTMELLELVKNRTADLAIVGSNEFKVQQSLYPRLKVAFDLSSEQDVVWYLPPGIDNVRLLKTIDSFIARLQQDGTMARLREEYFGHAEGISRISSHTFALSMRKSLPPYRALINLVANEYQMDWELLAAMAYQESHWKPTAESPTGVRGMMMLTRPTAKEMGVENRLDAGQSLRGGARYFKNIKRRLPQRIQEPDRTWMALAAYNIGMGHLEDARVITQRQGGDPDVWQDVMERLPLLQQQTHYKSTRYGYARGWEAVTYVQNIRHYYSILAWQEIPDNKPLPPLRIDEFIPTPVRGLGLLAL